MKDERLYIVTYDISDSRRGRRVFRTMRDYGDWLQLSVFQCRLTRRRRAELETRLRELVRNGEHRQEFFQGGTSGGCDIMSCHACRAFSSAPVTNAAPDPLEYSSSACNRVDI